MAIAHIEQIVLAIAEAEFDICPFFFAKNKFMHMTHSQMLGKVEYGLPAKIWRLVGCTEMLS